MNNRRMEKKKKDDDNEEEVEKINRKQDKHTHKERNSNGAKYYKQ